MRRGTSAALAFFILLAAIPPIERARADGPAPLPDLSVAPEDISFSYYTDPLDYGIRGIPIDIGVTVHNAGPGDSGSANVSLYIDGAFAALLHVMKALTTQYPENASTVHFTWDTTDAPSGNHTVRAVVNDTAGDAAPADNMAERVLRIYKSFPAATISLSPSHLEANVTASDKATVVFTGRATVDLGEWEEAALMLAASVDHGWAAAVAPGQMVFTSGESQAFNVTVVVPEASSASSSGSLDVDGLLRAETFAATASCMAIVTVRPYYHVSAESDTPEKEIGIDGVTSLKVKVHNLGNSVDSYNVTVENMEELKRAGWEVFVASDTIQRLPQGNYMALKVTVRAPDDWAVYENNVATIKLRFTSINAAYRGEDVSAGYSLVVRERGINAPCLVTSITVVALVILAAVAVVLVKRRGRARPKTVQDYMKELDLDQKA